MKRSLGLVCSIIYIVFILSACSSGGGGGGGTGVGGNPPGGNTGGNQSPVAITDTVPPAASGSVVILDGSRSSDPNGGSLTYSWSQVSGPTVTLSDATTDSAFFTAPTGTADLGFALTITNPGGLSSTATVTVSVAQTPPSPPPTSIALIDQAVKDGTLTAEQGLVHKVFAVFDDGSLPAEYQGAGLDKTSGTRFMAEAMEKYDTLSTEAKTQVYPYLLPPYVTNSWYDLATKQGKPLRHKGAAAKVSSTVAAPAAHPWKWVTNGKVKIWYQDNNTLNYADGSSATYASIATGILDAVGGKIWDALQNLMQREPLSDAGVALPAMPSPVYGAIPGPLDANGALDIVLCTGMNASGYTIPYKVVPTPAFITIDITMWKLGDETTPGLIQIVAHEMMHAWQFSYERQDAPNTYAWLMEATAAWTEDYVYPDANSQNRYAAWYLDTIPLSIDDQTNFRQYGAYTFFSYLTHAKAPADMVRLSWENAGTMDSLKAVDESTPFPIPSPISLPRSMTSPFEHYWGDALIANWNRGFDGFFFKQDKLAQGAKVEPKTPTLVNLGGSSDHVYYLDDLDDTGSINLPYLSGRYYHFKFTDDAARNVMFYDGIRSSLTLTMAKDSTMIYAGIPLLPNPATPLVDPAEGAQWRLIVKIDDVWKEWKPVQGNTTGMVSFCRDAKAERIQELVVVLGNSSIDKNRFVQPPGDFAPLLLVSNIGCFGWDGTITAKVTDSAMLPEETTATVQWRRGEDVMPNYFPPGVVPPGLFVLSSATFNTVVSGAANDCTYSGNDSWSWDIKTMALQDGPDASLGMMPEARSGGMYRIYDGDGHSGAHEVNYTYTCPPDASGSDTTKPTWWYPNIGSNYPAISQDGMTLQGSSDIGGTHYEWNLHGVREP